MRRNRQALDLFEGGRTLSRWALDASVRGFVIGDDIKEVQRSAREALAEALPMLQKLETDEVAQDEKERPLAIGPSRWETYRREAQREILDLNDALTK